MGGGDSAFWIGILALLALAVGGGALIMWARRAAKAPDPGPAAPFTLEDLRAMHERGEISRREFETARATMIERTREAARRERERRGGTDWDGNAGGENPGRARR